MNLRQAFIDSLSGKRKSKRLQEEQKPAKPKKEIKPSNNKKVICPHCGGDGIEPETLDYKCTVCLGRGKLSRKQYANYLTQKMAEK